MSQTSTAAAQARPVLSIVAGNPTAEETAAVTVVLAALASAAASGPQASRDSQRSAWSDPSRMLRPAVSPGAGAWRASGLPH